MTRGLRQIALLFQGLCLIGSTRGSNIQLSGLTLPSDASTNKALVQTVFLDAYNAYRKYAWTHDDLAPISAGYKDPRNGWGASAFDALGTLKIMGQTDLFNEAVSWAKQTDFSKSKTGDEVSFFETTIRYLGGLITAYDLGGRSDAGLLATAKTLGDKLAWGWPAGYKTPVGLIDFAHNRPDVGNGSPNGLAAAATNILEFAKLTHYTGNQTYLKLADTTMRAIATNSKPVFPGLPPQDVKPDGTGSGSSVSWDGGYDSYLEYLIKYARLTNFADSLWTTSWINAVESSITHLIKQSTGGQYFITSYSNGDSSYSSGDLACFAGGNWIMGGKLLDRSDIVSWGLKLTDGCMSTYNTSTGLGPGGWAFKGADGGGGSPPSSQQGFYNQNGFWITSGDYDVRPEVFESAFYAWRATGDKKYYDFAVKGIKAIQKYLKSNVGSAPLKDVMNGTPGTANQSDDLESFFFAEVMKYLYLTFDDPSHISLDSYIFNTECHPFLPLS